MPDDTSTAHPQTCVRCGKQALVRIVGRCADCIGHLGLAQNEDYAAWRAEVKAEFGVQG
jgi:ribosomal protein L37E